MTVKVVTDSSAMLPAEIVADLDIATVPLWLHFGDHSYRDGLDLDADEFYRRLAAGEIATTSSPSPGDFLRVYEAAADEAHEAVFVATVARRLSAIYDSARAALDEFNKVPGAVFDTGTAISGASLVVMEAARTAATGADLAEVELAAGRVAEQVDLIGSVDTLRYLRRSGRVNVAGFIAGEALRVKPLFRLRHGEVGRAGLARNRAAADDRIVDGVLSGAGRLHAGLFHAAAPERMERLEARIRRARPDAEILMSSFSPAMGAHTGPGVVGAAWWYS